MEVHRNEVNTAYLEGSEEHDQTPPPRIRKIHLGVGPDLRFSMTVFPPIRPTSIPRSKPQHCHPKPSAHALAHKTTPTFQPQGRMNLPGQIVFYITCRVYGHLLVYNKAPTPVMSGSRSDFSYSAGERS